MYWLHGLRPPTGSFDCIGAVLPTETISSIRWTLLQVNLDGQTFKLFRLMIFVYLLYIYWKLIFVFFSVSPCIICEFIDVNGFLKGIKFESLNLCSNWQLSLGHSLGSFALKSMTSWVFGQLQSTLNNIHYFFIQHEDNEVPFWKFSS